MNIEEIVNLHGIRKGDTIRVTDVREFRVEKVDTVNRCIKGVATKRDGTGDTYLVVPFDAPATVKSRECELIERPLPDLPTEIGSVIRFKGAMSGEPQTWMLTNSGVWRSSRSERHGEHTSRLARLVLAIANGEFEVLG